jgi:hypothetical protein
MSSNIAGTGGGAAGTSSDVTGTGGGVVAQPSQFPPPGWSTTKQLARPAMEPTRQMTFLTPDPIPAAWPPPAGGGAAMAYDTRRQVSVLFPGSEDGNPMTMASGAFTIWEWDGSNGWVDRSAAVPAAFPELEWPAVTYDSDRGVTILFGGNSPSSLTNDTWEWDGSTMKHPMPASAPPARAASAMAYDPVHKVTVLVGGDSLNDIWEWNGVTWTNRTPLTLPTAWPAGRTGATLVWDSVASRLLLFGGIASEGGSLVGLSDLWSWDGNAWTNLTPQPLPAAWPFKRFGHGAAFDECRGVMLVFGGSIDDLSAPVPSGRASDLWEWDSRTGIFRNLTPSMVADLPATVWPIPAYVPAVTLDRTYDRFIIFGGVWGAVQLERLMYVYGP